MTVDFVRENKSTMTRTFLLIVMTLSAALPALGELQCDQGRWRLELSGAMSADSGSESRQGDFTLLGAAEYEVPASSRVTLGLRLLPIFLYEPDGEGDTVAGAGVGLAARLYEMAEEHRGFFGELTVNALGHNHEIEGNGSNINFLSSIGVGYQFQSDWHVVLRFQHISNAGLDGDNAGANAIALGLGCSF